MSLSGLLNVARSSLTAQSGALGVTGKNISNATTPGYSRRVASIEGLVDGGVDSRGELRTVDRFSAAHVVEQEGKKGSADARADALERIESVIAPTDRTIGDSATAMMTSFVTLTAYPTDPGVRAEVLARASDLASTVSIASQRLGDTSTELFSRAQGVVGEVNERLEGVADLNAKIADAKARGSETATLSDRRDLLVREVGERVGVRAVEDPQGRVTLFGAGATLVDGTRTSPLAVDLDGSGAMRFTVQGTGTLDITARMDSGRLGGLREARDVDLAKAQRGLDAYAFDVSNTLNSVHQAGFGMDGGTGRPLFVTPTGMTGAASAMALDPSMVDRPDRLAAAASAAELPGGNGAAIQFSGLAESASFGGSTLANRFATLASDVGMRKASADSESSLRADTLSLAENMAESASGVSLDEEMIDMTRYQRAFEAASKVLRTADELLAGLMRDL